MSGWVQRGVASLCGRILSQPLLELLAEYMDTNRCVEELLQQLEEERCSVRREKLAVARLQREVARSKSEGTMREKLIHELEEERRLRLESEKRLREVSEESELGRAQMLSLQQQFSRMEETVRSLLQNQGVLEQSAVDTVDLMKCYKEKLSEEVQKQQDSPSLQPPDPELDASQAEDKTRLLVERLKALEEQNSALASENESQREQYERCLDEVANQVVQALLTQKDLREECLKLRTRVFDLEQQNRALSILFQQKIKPASDLLLQKLHSRIMDLSAADLLLEPERSKAFLLSRNSDSPSTEVQLNGKLGFPFVKCLSQLSLTVPPPSYPRSSCSSSELSLSSACSDFSSGSYTWNDGRSCGKMSSLTWEKRLSLGSSVPSNICATMDEPPPTRRKESHILEGLRKLQRRKHRSSSSSSSKVSKSGYKDCMNSNEGIYSLGIKTSGKGVSKPPHVSRMRGKRFSYDSDDADDELAQSSTRDNIPTKDGWFQCQRLSHSISDSLCSLGGLQDSSGDAAPPPAAAKQPPGYDSKERPEKLLSFINSFLPEGGRPSAFSRPSKLHRNQCDPPDPGRISDDTVGLKSEPSDRPPPEEVERDTRRLSRDVAKLLSQQYLRREQGRTQSAEGRPRPFSLIKEPRASQCSESEESILAIFDAEGEPIHLAPNNSQGGKGATNYAELVPQEKPTRQKPANVRTYSVVESPEKPSEYQLRARKSSSSREGSAERLSMPLTPQRKLIKPPSSRANKGLSIPPVNDASKSIGSKIPGRNKPTPLGPPIKSSKASSTEPSLSGNSAPCGLEKSPSSAGRMSRFLKTQGSCSQSPKVGHSKPPGRAEWGKTSSSCSPLLSRRHLEYGEGEQPTRDKHCETGKNKLRSPSPPPPPGRTTSLLIRPNYEGSPQPHHKAATVQPATPATVRGPPPSYHTSLLPNMQSTLPIRDKECADLDAGYGTAPHKPLDKPGQHPQKLSATTHTPTKGSKRATTKDYLPSANSGGAPEPQNAPKNSKNVPPPYSALRGPSLQTSFVNKRGSVHENAHQSVQKTSVSLPMSLQDSSQTVISPPSSVVTSPNPAEKASKTRIPMGFKAFLKSPPGHKNSPSIPGKQEKDHINSVSKETVTSSTSPQVDSSPPYGIDPPACTSAAEGKGDVMCQAAEEGGPLPVEGAPCDRGKRSSQLFGRSISVTTKPHLKPALGMTGAKARSQSFSTTYTEKPGGGSLEGPGKTRTHIITNSGERGSSLSRQSSSEVPGGAAESPLHSPRTRLSHYGGMTGSNPQSAPFERTKAAPKGEGSPSRKEVCSLPTADRMASNINRKGGAQLQVQPPSSCVHSVEDLELKGSTGPPKDFNREIQTPAGSPSKPTDTDEKKSPSTCTIEEKVMMGIEQNVQKCQEQEKEKVSEVKQKSGPSLANWFGLRRSKLPALSGKKAEPPKAREEKKEQKAGSVLIGKQKKDKKKNENQQKDEPELENLTQVNNKLSSIMDHCNNQMGQISTQIHCSTALIGTEHFMKELLGRTAVKTQPHQICSNLRDGGLKAEVETCADTNSLLMSQKLARAENEESACQDHVIGSGCQMRTLDSGIGTFPLHDSVSRASGRHLPRSESSPEGVTAGSSELQRPPPSSPPGPSLPHVKVPSPSKNPPHAPTSMGHSLSDPTVTCNGTQDAQSRLPKLASSDVIRTKRLSVGAPHSSFTDDKEAESHSRKTASDQERSGERALQVCTYSGSSGSDTETELEGTGSVVCSPQRTLLHRATTGDSGEQNGTLKRSLSIMDLYHQDMLSQLEKDSRRISQYQLLLQEPPLSEEKPPATAGPPPALHLSLVSLNKLNHRSSAMFPDAVLSGESCCKVDEPSPSPCSSSHVAGRPGTADASGSLSDSLYDSFSSCTSQGSGEV